MLDKTDNILRWVLDGAEGEEVGRGAGGETVPGGRCAPPSRRPRAPLGSPASPGGQILFLLNFCYIPGNCYRPGRL